MPVRMQYTPLRAGGGGGVATHPADSVATAVHLLVPQAALPCVSSYPTVAVALNVQVIALPYKGLTKHPLLVKVQSRESVIPVMHALGSLCMVIGSNTLFVACTNNIPGPTFLIWARIHCFVSAPRAGSKYHMPPSASQHLALRETPVTPVVPLSRTRKKLPRVDLMQYFPGAASLPRDTKANARSEAT